METGGRLKPIYETDRVTLYHGDALEVLPEIPRKSVGLLATDPPYGVKWQSGFGKNFDALEGDDGTLDVPGVLGAITLHALMPGRHVYVFGYTPESLREPLRLAGPCELIWNKGIVGMGDLGSPWGAQHERITFGVYRPSRKNREDGRGSLSARLRSGSILSIQRSHSRGIIRHPTEKPVELMRRIIESSSSIGDIVLDPFAGSGSTLVAAVLSGRKAIGIEIAEPYVNVAIERLKDAERVADLMDVA